MTADQQAAIHSLRDEGYAVIVWTPAELNGVCPRHLSDRSIELGWDVIDDLRSFVISKKE